MTVTISSIKNALSASAALMSKLASVNAANATSQTNNRLTLIGNQISAQLNKKIAQLQSQAQDPTVSILMQQETGINNQMQAYTTAEGQIGTNGSVLGDLSLQLSNMAVAAQAGDSTTFDQSLTSAQGDLNQLQVVSFAPGLMPDGIGALLTSGLNVQSSSTYNLGTSAGQTQALSAVQAVEAQVQQIATANTLNQQITASYQNALQTQLSGLSTQVTNLQNTEINAAATQIANMKQQAQMEYHLIELNFGNATTAASIITSVQSYQNLAAVPPGTTLGILAGNSYGEPTLPVANLTTTAPKVTAPSSTASSGGTSNSQPGSLFSTTA